MTSIEAEVRWFFVEILRSECAWAGAVSCLALGVACRSEPAQSAASAAPPAERAQATDQSLPPPGRALPASDPGDFSLATHRNVVMRPQNLVLSLPQGEAWVAQSRRGTWSGLRHEATQSEIWVRHAVARRTVTLDECEREARLSWELLREPAEVAVARVLNAPAGYGGQLRVILPARGGGRVEAFSVSVGRCLAVVFTTGETPGFPERLRVAANEIIPMLRVPTLDERGIVTRSTL